MYQKQALSYKHLDESLDEGRFVFEWFLAGNLQAFTTCRRRPQPFMFKTIWTILCISLA